MNPDVLVTSATDAVSRPTSRNVNPTPSPHWPRCSVHSSSFLNTRLVAIACVLWIWERFPNSANASKAHVHQEITVSQWMISPRLSIMQIQRLRHAEGISVWWATCQWSEQRASTYPTRQTHHYKPEDQLQFHPQNFDIVDEVNGISGGIVLCRYYDVTTDIEIRIKRNGHVPIDPAEEDGWQTATIT